MAEVITKINKTCLAVLLAAFVCVYPPTLMAYAEEDPEDGTTTAEEAIEPAPIPEIAEDDEAADNATEDAQASDDAASSEIATLSLDDTQADAATTGTAANAIATDATTADATASDSNVLNVGTYMELHDAFKYDINTQSNQTFVINLTADITLEEPETKYKDEEAHKWVFTYDTHGNKFTHGQNVLRVMNGNTVTVLGNGHKLIYNDNTTTNLPLGTINGNLILGAADGSDSLTLTFEGSSHTLCSLVDVTGGTAIIHDGVTLSNNVNYTAYAGGAINATNGAVVTMDGGLIENNTNTSITWGGGVNVDGATFNMTGGRITGNSEPAVGDYPGMGGGVSLANHGEASTFNMSGDAVIDGNTAAYGGGVYVGPNGVFNMSGNAAIVNNTATTYGGGVYVAQGGSFTMGEDNVIQGNSAVHGGGVMNFGTAVVTNVYDNDATSSGADLYNGGTITMEPVKADWTLSRDQATSDLSNTGASTDVPTDVVPSLPGIKFMSLAALPTASNGDGATAASTITTTNPSNKTIDDWYYDGHRETGDTDDAGNAVVDHSRWNANEDTADTPQYLMNYAATPTPTTEVMGLKAAHGASSTTETPKTVNVIWEDEDGTQLFKLVKVDEDHIPPADEYEALSGQEDPEKPADAQDTYEFEGWDRTDEPNGDVVYMAEYKAIPTHPDTHEEVVDPDPQDPQPHDDPVPNDTTVSADAEEGMPQTGDDAGMQLAVLGGLFLVAAAGAGFATYKLRAERH